MADTEESPAQRQARIRREKREAKIKSNGQERLDKITRLSGRTPESMRDTLPAATSTPMRPPSPPTPSPYPGPQPEGPPTNIAELRELKAQHDLMRSLLRGEGPSQPPDGQQPGEAQEEDPMVKMLQSMMGQMNGDPNAPEMPSLNMDDISKMTGLPSFVTNMFLGQKETPPTPEQQKEVRTWSILHVLFAFLAGIYMVISIDSLTGVFGSDPPAPATFKNPVSLFFLGEGILYGSRATLSNTLQKRGFWFWIQTGKDIIRDALVMVFILGVYTWWQGLA